MKNIIFVLSISLGSLSATSAILELSPITLNLSEVQERVSVRIDDLPEAVKNAIRNSSYSDWKMDEAFLVTREDKSKYYEVKVKHDEQRATLRLDKEGQSID
tara:strand:- start:254 stop:559 length:306 start_codon:yes stop_codon:yes gene_type:complete